MKKLATKKVSTSKRGTSKKAAVKKLSTGKAAGKRTAKPSMAKKAAAVEAKFRPVCLTHPKKLGGFISKAEAKEIRDGHEAQFPGHITDNEERQQQ